MLNIVEKKLDREQARKVGTLRGAVSLQLDELDSVAAKELAQFQGEVLVFGQFPKMDDRAARELLKIDSSVLMIEDLFASDQHTIEDNTFLALSRYVGSIMNLEGCRPLDAVGARELVDFGGEQLIIDQDALDLETATSLALAEPALLSVCVQRMNTEVARALSHSRADRDLQVIVENGINLAVASELAQYQGDRLWISWVDDRIDPETARALADVEGALRLEIVEIDRDVARALARRTGVLDLDCLRRLDVETARELGKAKCSDLILDGLQTIDSDVAEELAKFEGWLCLEGLTHLEPTVARILANAKAEKVALGYRDGRTKVARVWKAAQAEMGV